MKYLGLLSQTVASLVLAIAVTVSISEDAQASFTGTSVNSYEVTNTVSDDLDAQLQNALDQALDDIPGAAVAIVSPRGTWFGASGASNLQTGTEVVLEDRFQIGSITKTFVATTILQLVEEGRLSLDDTLDQWLPPSVVSAIPNHESITIRQLLNHTSGLSDYLDPLFIQAQTNIGVFFNDWQPEELVFFIDGQDPLFEPGESWAYSSTNYILLGMIAESVTNSSIASEIRSRILEPLDLDDTFFANEETITGGFVNGYWDFDNNGSLNDTTPANMSWAWAAGAMVSNTQDLARFMEALLINDELLEPESLDQMLTFVNGGASENYAAYGLGIGRLESPRRLWYGHRGQTLGYRSNLFYSPVEDIIYVELINLVSDRNISNPIFAVWRNAVDPTPSVSEPAMIPGLLSLFGAGLFLKWQRRHP
ncbi:serine hydrolase [Chroococcus sp. FPU101]|uniref:serine hydrolase domain-containing protein n=1 Tax=Chroococcus sp. FPU101 TaxID=1974212 RepID=UPI001A8F6D96|nr:serine hydrolase domain-containing protein [Chroococcus sp. FPU101]GFE67444.1 serine-type D-Ala-D-Ala carboxypeptidase [Chroococcus sp. FPU101]